MPNFVAIACKSDVIFLVNGLQLGVETAYNHVLETVGLYFCPVVHFVSGDVFRVTRNVVAGVCVGFFGSDRRHQLVVLVGDEVFGSQLRHAVYAVVGFFALFGVGKRAVFLVPLFDVFQQGRFFFGICCAELFRSLKHQVFQIVCQARSFGGVVSTSRLYCYVGVNAWCLFIYREIHAQSVVQGVDARSRWVALHRLVLVIFCLHGCCRSCEEQGNQNRFNAHTIRFVLLILFGFLI